MITFAVCDDDIGYMEQAKGIIAESFDKYNDYREEVRILCYSSQEELIEGYIKEKVDVVFLDIECGDALGFDIARKLVEIDNNLGVVYMTNYNHYISRAFVCRPLGFICKGNIREDIELALMNIYDYLKVNRRVIRFVSKTQAIAITANELWSVEVFNHNLILHTIRGDMEIRGQLSKYEKELVKDGFIKISRGILINMKFIRNIKGMELLTKDNRTFVISRDRIKAVKEGWLEYKVS